MVQYFALALSLVTPTVSAEITIRDFCEQPYEAVCGRAGEAEMAREKRVSFIKKKISRLALDVAAGEVLGQKPGTLSIERLEALTPEHVRSKARHVYYRALRNALQAELGESYAAAMFHFERIRENLKQPINRLADVSYDEARQMYRNLGSIKFINALDLMKGMGPEAADEALVADVVKDCGQDGMVDNAFAFDHEGVNYVVLCPGAAIAALGPSDKHLKAKDLALAGVIWLMGHETGHHIDAGAHPVTYAKLASCIADNYLDDLGEIDDDGNKKSISRSDVNHYMSEISADYWGSEELASFLEKAKSPRQQIRIVQESLEFLCGTVDDGSHPSGRFRIENLVRRNPRIHKALGCKAPKAQQSQPTCTLRGQWRDAFF